MGYGKEVGFRDFIGSGRVICCAGKKSKGKAKYQGKQKDSFHRDLGFGFVFKLNGFLV